jgi:hypothetical protein
VFGRYVMIMTVLSLMVSACAPEAPTNAANTEALPSTQADPNSAIKDELAPIVKAMLGGTISDQLALIEYTQTACANVEGLGGPPHCPEGIAEGTTVQVFPILGSEGSFIKPEEMQQVLTNVPVNSLYAVYRVTPNPNLESYYPQGEYAMLFERDVNGQQLPLIVLVAGGKIVRIDFDRGVSAADLLKEIPAKQVIVSPQEAEAWMQAVK